jgi:hypothetical protein
VTAESNHFSIALLDAYVSTGVVFTERLQPAIFENIPL